MFEELTEMHGYLYKLVHARSPEETPGKKVDNNNHLMLLVFSDKQKITIERKPYHVGPHKVILLPAGLWIEDESESMGSLALEFVMLEETQANHYAPVSLSQVIEVELGPFPSLYQSVLDIRTKWSGERVDQLKAQHMFLELLIMIMENAAEKPHTEHERVVKQTVEYIHRHYHRHISREHLAERAGLSSDYFTRIFKRQLGKSPMSYLSAVRLNHAKQELLLTKDSFRTIAQRIGYADEFYFSRKFRMMTGMSPSMYVKQMKKADKIVSLHHHLTGHLLALGIEPYAAIVNSYYPIALHNTIEIGHFRPDLDKLASVNPDVIFTCDIYDEETSAKAKMFEHITQTISIPFYDDWRTQFCKIATATGKDKEAGLWLERYQAKSLSVRTSIKPYVEGKTALIIGLGNGILCLFGQRNVGAVVYDDLGLKPPSGLGSIPLYREIAYEDIFDYDPDIIFLTSFRNDGSQQTKTAIRQTLNQWYRDPRWKSKRAVRNQEVYSLLESQHLYTMYTAYSHDLLLDRLHDLLVSDLSKEWT